jgi:hypothetical protein
MYKFSASATEVKPVTPAAEAGFFDELTAGLKSCSTRFMLAELG